MLIEFTVSNYRSIKEEKSLDLTASGSNFKKENLIELANDLRLIKSLVIYGSNGSGKSNLIRAFWIFKKIVSNSTDFKKGDVFDEKHYDPFRLDESKQNEPTRFSVTFLLNGKKYIYSFSYNKEKIIEEKLTYYDTNQPSVLFERINGNEFVEVGKNLLGYKTLDTTVLHNNLYLSKIGNSPNKQIGEIYLYFKNVEVWNAINFPNVDLLSNRIQALISLPANKLLKEKLSKLISIADIRIDEIRTNVNEKAIDIGNYPPELRPFLTSSFPKFNTFGVHKVFSKEKHTGYQEFEFKKYESSGTHAIFAIGGLILSCLLAPTSRIILIDEFHTSIHPELTTFLIEIFQNPLVNTNNSQIIFTSHETQLLECNLFRKDQIWFAEKDRFGASDFFSVSDFSGEENVREGIAFDKWYKQGRFGGIPNVRKSEFFSTYEKA